MQFDVTVLLTHQAYGPRYYWRPPHKPLPSREALVLSTDPLPFRQVAETLPLRPEDNQPNPCDTKRFSKARTRQAAFDSSLAPKRYYIAYRPLRFLSSSGA